MLSKSSSGNANKGDAFVSGTIETLGAVFSSARLFDVCFGENL